MRVGLFRRGISFILDISPIFLVLSLLFSLFVGDMLQSRYDNFDRVQTLYQENRDEYFETADGYREDLNNEVITTAEYEALIQQLTDRFANNNEYLENVIFSYYSDVVVYYFVSYIVIYYFYNLFMKGQTLGRRFMKIELAGKINWWTLLIREFLWKNIFWVFTFTAGIAIDIGLIAFTKKKKTIRDLLSETYLTHEGVNYPF